MSYSYTKLHETDHTGSLKQTCHALTMTYELLGLFGRVGCVSELPTRFGHW